ncbi:hypothetical protein Tco_0571318 [Tanacetum coccineum]
MYPSNNSNNMNEMHGKRKHLLMKMRYGYIKNHKKTVKNGQTRTRESEEYKRSQRFKAKARKSQPPVELVQPWSTEVNPQKDKTLKVPFQSLKNGNTKEKKYIISLYKIHAERFSEADMEEKMNRWVRKEFKTFNEDARLLIQYWKDSWHKRVYKKNQRKARDNPEDYFSNHRITEVVRINTDQPHSLNFTEQIIAIREKDKPDSFSKADFNKDEKRVMYLEEIVKFCDATLEKVLKEVKLKIFQSEPWKKHLC